MIKEFLLLFKPVHSFFLSYCCFSYKFYYLVFYSFLLANETYIGNNPRWKSLWNYIVSFLVFLGALWTFLMDISDTESIHNIPNYWTNPFPNRLKSPVNQAPQITIYKTTFFWYCVSICVTESLDTDAKTMREQARDSDMARGHTY